MELAEAQAVHEGVAIAIERVVCKIVEEIDPLVAFCVLRRPKKDISYFASIITEILALCSNFESVSFN